MKKLLLLICALLGLGTSGAWAQLTSISDGGYYSIRMARTDQNYKLGVTRELKHADQSLPVVAGVFQITETGETDTYYIKDCYSGKYVYADRTSNSSGKSDVAIKLGETTLPSSSTSETKSENLNYYKWIITYVGTKGTYATDAWTIVPSQTTTTQWAVYSQSGENPVAFFNRDDGNGYYIWGFVQFLKPTVLSSVLAKLTFKQIKDLGYTVDQITAACRPSTLDAPGWPSTTTYNTFKSTVEGLADGDLVSTSYNSMWDARLFPTVGHFYRLKGTNSNKYLKGAASTTDGHTSQWLNATNQDGALSIFYYDTDKTLISYTNGRKFTGTHSIANVGETGNTFTFQTPYDTYVASKMYGSLSAKSDASGVGQYLYSHTGSEDYVNRNGGKAFETNWTVEDVTSLPVTISAASFATFYSPVALTVPEGLTAYVGRTISDDKLWLTTTDVIPAGQGVILQGSAGTYNLTIGGSSDATSAIKGSAATVTKASVGEVLTLTQDGSGNPVFRDYTGTNLTGFKGYIPANDLPGGVKSFTIDFYTDAITALQAEKLNNGQRVFDLNGRRVERVKRGMYVVNGRKVLINK